MIIQHPKFSPCPFLTLQSVQHVLLNTGYVATLINSWPLLDEQSNSITNGHTQNKKSGALSDDNFIWSSGFGKGSQITPAQQNYNFSSVKRKLVSS